MLASHRVVESYLQEFVIRARVLRAVISRVLLLTRGGDDSEGFTESLGAGLDVAANDCYGRFAAEDPRGIYTRQAALDARVIRPIGENLSVAIGTLSAAELAMGGAWTLHADVSSHLLMSLQIATGLGSTHPRGAAVATLVYKVDEAMTEGLIYGSCLPQAYLSAVIAGLVEARSALQRGNPSAEQLRALGVNAFKTRMRENLKPPEAEVRSKCRHATRLLRNW